MLKTLGSGEGARMNVLCCQVEGYKEALSLVGFRHQRFGRGDAALAYDNPITLGDLPNAQRITNRKGLQITRYWVNRSARFGFVFSLPFLLMGSLS